MIEKKRKRLIRRLNHEIHDNLHQRYHCAVDSYVMSKIMKKSPQWQISPLCQRELGKHMIRLGIGMRYYYGYTFTQFRWDIRRKTDLWKMALHINDPHAANLQVSVLNMNAIYCKSSNWKLSLCERGYEGLTIYQPVFPCDIEYKEWSLRQSKNRFKSYFMRLRKAKRLKKAGKKNWKAFEPK